MRNIQRNAPPADKGKKEGRLQEYKRRVKCVTEENTRKMDDNFGKSLSEMFT